MLFPPETILKQIDFWKKRFTDFIFWTFLEEGHILNIKNYHLNFFQKKETGSCNKPFFLFSHELTIACGIQLSLISPAGHLVHQAISLFSAFFFEQTSPDVKNKLFLNFFLLSLLFFQLLIFSHFFAWIVLQYFSWQKITFSSCHLLVFILCFLTFFFCLEVLSRRCRKQTRHQDKRAKPIVGMVTRVWKRGLLLAFFFSMTESLSWWTRTNQRESVGWLCCVTQTARRTPAGEDLSSFPHVLCLHSYSLYVDSRRASWDRSLAGRLRWTWRINFLLLDAVLRWSCMQCGWSTTEGRVETHATVELEREASSVSCPGR